MAEGGAPVPAIVLTSHPVAPKDAVGVTLGVTLGEGGGAGVPLGVALGMPLGVPLGAPLRVPLGVPLGVVLGVPLGVLHAATFAVEPAEQFEGHAHATGAAAFTGQ